VLIIVLTSRLSLHKPEAASETFGDYFIAYYAADLQKLDDEVQIKNLAAAGHIPVYDENGILVDSLIAPGDIEVGLLDSILNTQGMLLFRGAAALQAISPSTAGKSLLTQGAGANPAFGYPSHSTLVDLTTGDPHTQYYNETRGDLRYAPIAKGVTNGDSHAHTGGAGAAIVAAAMSLAATSRILGRKTADAGAGEECTLSEILDFIGSATRGDILYRGASAWARLPKGTSGQALVMGANDPAWTARAFDVPATFGDGSTIISGSSYSCRVPIASKIVAARIRSYDAAGAPVSGSITCTLYIHDIDAAIGAAVDSFALSSSTNYTETGLNITVAAGKWLTIVVSGITSIKQITLTLALEAT
jgi:hypothetical protein